MIEKYGAEVEIPEETVEPEHPGTGDSSSLPASDSS